MKINPVQQGQGIDFNNQAVAYLQAGQSREAMASLRKAASILRDHFPPSETTSGNENPGVPCTTTTTKNSTSTTSSNTPATTPGTSHMPCDDTIHCQKDETASTTSTTTSNVCHTPTTTAEDVEMEVKNEEEDDDDEEEEVYEAVIPLVFSVPASLDSPSSSTKTTTTAPLSSFSSFNRAFVVSPLLQDAEIMSGVILYNMGLINHLHGLRRGLSSFVDQALRLYQTGLVIMQTCYNENIGKDDDDKNESHFLSTSLVLLALLNNSAQIYSHLIQREGLSYSLDCMRHVLGSTSPSGGVNPIVRRLQQQQQADNDEHQANNEDNDNHEYESYSFFYMNTMVYSVVDSLALAPAA
jgi:hypothetical protein